MLHPFKIGLAFVLLLSARAAAQNSPTGPWDVERIRQTFTPVHVDKTTSRDDCEIGEIRYQTEPYQGRECWVFAYFARPRVHEGKLPAMLLVHGGGGKAFTEWAEQWARRGYAALAMDLAGHGADGKPLEAGGPNQDDAAKFDAITTAPLTDAWPYQAVAAVLRGHNVLRNSKEVVDPERIGITGISWGGYLTCIVAGIDHDLKVAVPVYGCGFLNDNSAWKDGGIFDRLPAAARDKWLANFDPSRYLSGVRCPILFVNGTNDFAYPMDSHQRSHELVTAPKTLSVTVNMPHSHPDGWAPREIGAFVDSVLKEGTPLPTLGPLRVEQGRAIAGWSGTPVVRAALHWTTDTGPWQKREWKTAPAEVDADAKTATAAEPTERPLVMFLTAVDDRGLTVSTPYVTREKE